jgi:hypothetical protein
MQAVNGVAVVEPIVEYTEYHLHHKTRWFTKKTSQTETEWCSPLEGNIANFYRAISESGAFGTNATDTAKLFGSADIPIPGMTYGDFDEILVIANSSTTVYLCRIIWGTGTVAEAVAAGQYTEFPFLRGNADNVRKVMKVSCEKIPITIGGLDVKVWLQCANASDDATFDFVIGIHGGYGF